MADQEPTGTATRVQRVLLCKCYERLHDSAQFLGAALRGVHVAVSNQLAREVREQRAALIARQA
jgi:hypothetical protein